MTFEDLLNLKGYYRLDFIPQNKILRSMLDHFPIKYYTFTHPQGKQGSWLKQKPVVTFFFARHSQISQAQFKQPSYLSSEIKSPYTEFRKIFKLLQNVNRNGIDSRSPIVELLQAVSIQNFLQEDQDNHDNHEKKEKQDSPYVQVPFHLDIYGCVDVPFNPTTPKDLQGLPQHNFYIVNQDQKPRLISYVAKKTEIFLQVHENNLKTTLLQGSIPLYLKIQAGLIFITVSFSSLLVLLSYIFDKSRAFKISAFCVISLLILSNLGLYGYRKIQARNFFDQYASWNILRLKSRQLNEMKLNFTDDYHAELFLHERTAGSKKKIVVKKEMPEVETKILPKDWKKHAVSPKDPETVNILDETTTNENLDQISKTKKIHQFFDAVSK
jgi:hypothetical protein